MPKPVTAWQCGGCGGLWRTRGEMEWGWCKAGEHEMCSACCEYVDGPSWSYYEPPDPVMGERCKLCAVHADHGDVDEEGEPAFYGGMDDWWDEEDEKAANAEHPMHYQLAVMKGAIESAADELFSAAMEVGND